MDTNILKKALISEKSFSKVAEDKFTFIVAKSATKESVAEIVKELFGVDVLRINTITVVGKVKRSKKGLGKRSDFKKAIVTLKKGQKIDLFEIEQKEDKTKEKAKKDKTAQPKNDKIEKESTNTTVKVRERKRNKV